MSEQGEQAAHQVAPGWYERPDTPGAVRYWDGVRWTDQLAPTAAFATQRQPDPVPDGLLVVGYITMLLMPLVGGCIGIYAMAKGETKAGAWMFGVSILASAAWTYSFIASAPTPY